MNIDPLVHYFTLSTDKSQTDYAVCGFRLVRIPIPNTPFSTFSGGFTYQRKLATCPKCKEIIAEKYK